MVIEHGTSCASYWPWEGASIPGIRYSKFWDSSESRWEVSHYLCVHRRRREMELGVNKTIDDDYDDYDDINYNYNRRRMEGSGWCESEYADSMIIYVNNVITAPSTSSPTAVPTMTTESPTRQPTDNPSQAPTGIPTENPTNEPIATSQPSNVPTKFPTDFPTGSPTRLPTGQPRTNIGINNNDGGNKSKNNGFLDLTSEIVIIILCVLFLIGFCVVSIMYCKKVIASRKVHNINGGINNVGINLAGDSGECQSNILNYTNKAICCSAYYACASSSATLTVNFGSASIIDTLTDLIGIYCGGHLSCVSGTNYKFVVLNEKNDNVSISSSFGIFCDGHSACHQLDVSRADNIYIVVL